MRKASSKLHSSSQFTGRHIGPREHEIETMLKYLDVSEIDELMARVVPGQIRTQRPLEIGQARSETEALEELSQILSQNKVFKSYIGMGYSDCITPSVIQRNILENPGWYTQYTPYQAEIAQGRLEALLNFQTMISDLTGLPIANASLLDEGTAAAEAMTLAFSVQGKNSRSSFFVSEKCHPQTLSVLKTRAEPLGIRLVIGDHEKADFKKADLFGILVQYPGTDGILHDYRETIRRAHQSQVVAVVAADLLSLAVFVPPGEMGADIVVGSSQRFGVPLGYGGPHAAYFATKEEFKRLLPGRIVGLSQDVHGRAAVRLALQTREQHIRRDKATSNICTAQALLAIVASMYAVYHGPNGLKEIAEKIRQSTARLRIFLEKVGYQIQKGVVFDTLKVSGDEEVIRIVRLLADTSKINLRSFDSVSVGVSLDETTSENDLKKLALIFSKAIKKETSTLDRVEDPIRSGEDSSLFRTSSYLAHPVFNSYHSETEMLRYIHRLQNRDLSLAFSMIPLGSCTMKLNATSEMIPISWPEVNRLHPFVPLKQAKGYHQILTQLEKDLAEVTGFSAVSLQPNAGSQGEYAGLLAIRKYHEDRGDRQRDVCLIPRSAHGTNPASAAMAGMKVVVVECDRNGNIDPADLQKKAITNRDQLAALMITYPSTHGVFEEGISEICDIVHQNGGQVYMDGANMNALIGLCRPGEFGPDLCHLNLHKTFCIPHGGGGPGMGPIAVKAHLQKYLPSHPLAPEKQGMAGAVSAAPWGSASILPISWMYIRMMGSEGLKRATEVAILNANYVAKKLSAQYPVLFAGRSGYVAHECIFDLRALKETAGVDVEDVAKRLMDYGFHAPTISFPVPGTVMVEPTESESLAELDRFCEAMTLIREEIREIEEGKADRQDNLLKNAPHTAEHATSESWKHPYSRDRALFPASWVRERKFWPSVGRINNVLGDRQLICTCPPMSAYETTESI